MKHKITNVIAKATAAMLVASMIPVGAVSAAGEASGSLDALNKRGFSTHFMTGNTLEDMDTLKASGAQIVRDEVGWSMIEHQPGVYNFSDFNTTYPLNLAEKGIDIILVLDYQNDLYVTGALDTDYERNAFANYCVAVAKQYPQIDKFEIWNEPNLFYDWNWHQDPTDYIKLLKTASEALRSVNPNATIIGGSLSDYQGIESYIADFYAQADLYSSADAVSIHPYWYYSTTPQRIFESRLRLHNRSLAATGGFKDLYITEIGFPSYTDENAAEPYLKSISEQEQAEGLIKSYVLSDHYNLDGTMAYDFKNDGTDAAEKEHNFGAINADGTPKKAYNAIKEMNSRISGASYMGTLIPKPHRSSIHTSTDIHIYDVDGTPVGIAWYANDDNPDKTLTYKFNESVDVYDLYGNKLQSGVSSVELTKEPVYIYGLSKEEMYKAAQDLAADFSASAVTAAEALSGNYAAEVKTRMNEINTLINNGVNSASSAKEVFDKIMGLGDDVVLAYIGGELGTNEKTVGTALDSLSNAAKELMKVYADDTKKVGEYYSLTSTGEIAQSQDIVSKSSSEVAKAILKRAKNYNEQADTINQINGLKTGTGMTKAMDLQSAGLAKWARLMAYDASEVNIEGSFDEDGYLTIRGNVGKNKQQVSVYVLKPSANGKISPAGIDYIDQLSTADKAYFVKKYLSCGEKGTYKIVAYSKTAGEIKTAEAVFYKKNDIVQLAQRLKSASSATEAAKIMTTADDEGNMPADILGSFSALFKQAISDNMSLEQFGEFIYNRRSEIDTEDNDNFIKLTDAIAAICAMNAVTSSRMDAAITNYASAIGFKQLNAYTTYTSSQSHIKNAICEKLAKRSFDSNEKWCEAFSEDVILTAIERGDYTNVYSVITTNNDKLNISLTEYNALSQAQKQRALMNFAGKAYADYEQVKNAFNTAVKNAKESTVTPGGGGSGSGNSSGAAGNANITVKPNTSDNGFNDLGNYDWAKADIENLVKKGIVNGVSDTEFAPQNAVKREEFVKMLVLALGLTDSSATAEFEDVDTNAWYYPYIASAFKAGVVSGETESLFGIGKNITREQMAAMIFRACKANNINFGTEGKEFTDADSISEYAVEAVKSLSSNGILSGYEDGSFRPDNSATRAEAAVIISRVCNLK